MSKNPPAARSGASPAGWHFVETARLCPHKFYLRHVLGLVPRFLARELLFGLAFHAAKAAFYTTKSRSRLAAAVKTGLRGLEDSRPLYSSDDEYQVDAARLGPLLEAWSAALGFRDLEVFTVLGAEIPVEVTLPSGRIFTGRLDAAVSPSGDPTHVRVLETKTTGWDLARTISGVRVGGQIRGYALAARARFPAARSVDIVADVAAWRKNSLEPSQISCERSEPITFPAPVLAEFAESLDQSLGEISERVAAWEAGESRARAFPRAQAPGICTAYNRPCEYFPVCEASIQPGESWDGYEWDEAILERARRAWAARAKKGARK